METTTNNSNSKTKALLAVLSIMGALLFIACIIFHLTPGGLADSLIDFAGHHYFLMGFISLTLAIACWKMYSSLDLRIDKRYQKKNIPFTRIRKKRIMMFKALRDHYFKKSQNESVLIEPEFISTLKFIAVDVLTNEESRIQRQRDLQKAMVLGNSFKQKVIIY